MAASTVLSTLSPYLNNQYVTATQILTSTLTEPLCRSKDASAFLNGVGVLGVMTDFRNTGVSDSDLTWLSLTHSLSYSHTHTHPFNGPFPGTTRVSRYQKGKTNLDFTELTDNEWQWHQLGHMQVCTSLQTNNHASTPPLSLLQARCPSCRPTNSIKALKE